MVSFWSSSTFQNATARLDHLKQAETALIRFARRYAEGNYDIQAYDTIIPRSCIPSLKPCPSEGDELVIHAIHVEEKQCSETRKQKSAYPLVALHGYYNGAAYYYRNLLGLANYFDGVYSLDALGWGLSSRPNYGNLKNNQSVESAEDWFVESLEAWRKENEINKMVLLGHSFGGYMSVAYAERYPERVERLLLLSPVGVPDENDPSFKERKQRLTSTFRSRMFIGVFQTLFAATTVGGFLRNFVSDQRSYGMVSSYVEGRLPSIEALDEQKAVTEYLFNNALAAGSGENAIHAILTKDIMARRPLVHRIPKLKVKNISMFYGQYDWMDMSGGLSTQKSCQESQDAPSVQVYMVRNAGHLLMLENPTGTNVALIAGSGGAVDQNSSGHILLKPINDALPDSVTRRRALQYT